MAFPSHGPRERPCDGAGGALKRKARKASLQIPPDKQITTAFQLYEWAVQDGNFSKITSIFKSEQDYENPLNF